MTLNGGPLSPPSTGGVDAETLAAAAVADRPSKLDWKKVFREARNWRELAESPHGLRPVLVLISMAIFFDINGAVAGVAFRDIIRDVDIDFVTYMRYIQFVGFAANFFILGVAHYADRHKRVPLVGIGVLLGGIAHGLGGAAGSSLAYGTSGVVSTAFFLVAQVPLASLLADYYPHHMRGKVFALLAMATSIPSVVIPKVAGEMVEALGWRPLYILTSIPIALVGIAASVVLREPIRGYMERRALGADDEVAATEEEPVSLSEAWRTVFAIRTIRRLFIANLITAPASRIFGTLSAAFYFEHYGLTPSTIGTLAMVSALITLPAVFLSGGLADVLMKYRPSKLLTYYSLLIIVGTLPTLLFISGPPLWVLVIVNGMFAFSRQLVGPAISMLYLQITPAHIRNVAGGVRGLSDVSAPIGGFFIGAVMVAYGLQGGMLLVFPFFLIGGLISLSAAPLFELDMRAAMAANLAGEEARRAQEEGNAKLLVCRDVDVAYNGVQVLFGVDFDVEDGQILALLGTNGAGKSTLLRAIAGLQQAASGAILFDGRDITHMPPHETAARGIVFMPGGRGVFPGLTVRENILLGHWMIETEEEVEQRLAEVYQVFPVLEQRADALAGSLSGGEQQQLSLAQAFLCRPRLLMIDELSLGLSPAVVAELIEVVRRIHATGVTVIVVEQSVNVALTIADRAVFMEKGEVRFFGDTADLLERPDILRAVYVKGSSGSVAAKPGRRRSALEAPPSVLQVEEVTKRYGGVVALDAVNLEVADGEVVGLIGPNGSGKTTLLDVISGYQQADGGKILLEGVDVTALRPQERAEAGIVRRFQDARLFPSLTVFETLLVSLEQHLESKGALAAAAGLPHSRRAEARTRRRAEELIELLDLGSYRDKFVRELSTGLRRIVDVACVLANQPKLLLLDEPSSGIAQAETEGLAPLLNRVRSETGCAIVIIEHDMPLISSVADELVALDRGGVLVRGVPSAVLSDERVIESYLGSNEATVRRSGSLA